MAKKLDIRPSKFSIYVQRWRENNFEESRGQNNLLIETELAVYNTWLENSIVSTDGRNGRNEINISKRQYLQMCGEIRSDLIELTEKKQKGQDDGLWPKKGSDMYSKNIERKMSGEKHWC